MPVARLIDELAKRNLCLIGQKPSLATAYRILKQEGIALRKTDHRRYEAEYPNDIWQSDVIHGPRVLAGGKRRKTHLIAFLDDHSRLLPHAICPSGWIPGWMPSARPFWPGAFPASSTSTMAPPSAPVTWSGSAPHWASP